MPQLEQRSFVVEDFEVRGAQGRTVSGLLVPFDRAASIGGRFSETFRLGAFRNVKRPPPLYAMHRTRTDLPIGRFAVLREEARGLYGEVPVARTAAGDEALELVKSGVLDQLSIGFLATNHGDRWSADRKSVERLLVDLREVSLVAAAAYADAVVESVRTDAEDGGAGRPRLLALRRFLATN